VVASDITYGFEATKMKQFILSLRFSGFEMV